MKKSVLVISIILLFFLLALSPFVNIKDIRMTTASIFDSMAVSDVTSLTVNVVTSPNFNYSEFSGAWKGNSTDFSAFSYFELQNITNLTFENTNYGRILFNDSFIDLSNNTDFDFFIEIGYNSIFINSSRLPNLNRSATLKLNNLSLNNPRLVRDGIVCPDTICTIVSYNSGTGTLVFTVTHFSEYRAEETPSGGGQQVGGGGGGGGGAAVLPQRIIDFSLSEETIEVSLESGKTKTILLDIENTGNEGLDLTMDLQKLARFIILPGGVSKYDFSLKPSEKQTIQLTFTALEDTEPRTYVDEIEIESVNTRGDFTITKKILTVININSKEILFDIKLNVLPEYKKVKPGGLLYFDAELFNLLGKERFDVSIEYGIKNKDDKIIFNKQEVMAIETSASFIRALILPVDLEPGTYVLYMEVKYDNIVFTNTDTFEVIKGAYTFANLLLVFIGIMFVLQLMAVIFLLYKLISLFKTYHKVNNKLVKKHIKIKKTRKVKKIKIDEDYIRVQLNTLKEAYESGLLSKKTYDEEKEKLKKLL